MMSTLQRLSPAQRQTLWLAICLLLAIALRLLLFFYFPALLTNDSPDYIKSAYAIYTRLDFTNEWLGDVRMPGYSTILAALYPLTGTRSDLLVAAQSLLGLICVPLGWLIGRRLHSPRAAAGLAIFFAANPAYLLLEHTLMTEAPALLIMVVFTLLALLWIEHPRRAWLGLLAGGVLGLGGLVRVNLLPYGAVLLALPAVQLLARIVRARGAAKRALRSQQEFFRRTSCPYGRRLIRVLLPPMIGLLVTLGPWLWRNYALYGNLSLSEHSDRSLLMWKTMSGTMDRSLPLFQQYASGHAALDFYWLNEFSPQHTTVEAEAIAGAIVREQVRAHPAGHLRAMLRSGLNHIGVFIEGYVPRDDRAMLAYWFHALVPDPAAVESSVPAVREWLDFHPVTQPSLWTWLWSVAGTIFLQVLRPLLFAAFAAAVLRLAFCARRGRVSPLAFPTFAVLGLSAAYAATLAFHAVTLTGSDRFGTLSDWVMLAVVLFVFPRCPAQADL